MVELRLENTSGGYTHVQEQDQVYPVVMQVPLSQFQQETNGKNYLLNVLKAPYTNDHTAAFQRIYDAGETLTKTLLPHTNLNPSPRAELPLAEIASHMLGISYRLGDKLSQWIIHQEIELVSKTGFQAGVSLSSNAMLWNERETEMQKSSVDRQELQDVASLHTTDHRRVQEKRETLMKKVPELEKAVFILNSTTPFVWAVYPATSRTPYVTLRTNMKPTEAKVLKGLDALKSKALEDIKVMKGEGGTYDVICGQWNLQRLQDSDTAPKKHLKL